MKRLIAVVILLIFIISICYIGNLTVTKVHDLTISELNDCEAAILNSDNTKAASKARLAVSYWKRNRILLSFFINHSRYDAVEIALVKASKLSASRDLPGALEECAEARVILREIYEEQHLSIENIF